MAKFKAGDMITNGYDVLMVNRSFTCNTKYSFYKGKELYSLDDGNGFSDARDLVSAVDENYRLCD